MITTLRTDITVDDICKGFVYNEFEGKGLFGIYIHNIPDPVTGKCKKGENPFLRFKMNRDGKTLRSVIKCYDPEPKDAYNCIFEHIEDWVDDAESIRYFY